MSKKIDFVPLNNYVIVEVIKVKEKTETGIIKSKGMIEEEKVEETGQNFFEVLAVANNIEDIFIGDKVMMNAMQLQGIMYKDVEYGLIGYQHLIGVIPKIKKKAVKKVKEEKPIVEKKEEEEEYKQGRGGTDLSYDQKKTNKKKE